MTGFLDRKPGRAELMIALNVTAPTRLAYRFGAGMRARGRGAIIIVGSNSSHTGAPGQVVYSAAKAYEFHLAEGLWAELHPHGVDVLGLILGLSDTPNIRRMGFSIAGHEAADPDDVAQEGLDHLGQGPIRVIGGWTDHIAALRGLPRDRAMALAGKNPVEGT
jgi:short-subunit dehydrogenase